MKYSTKIKYGPLIIPLVFFSGFASLTYQVIWERTLKYCFGGDVISASIIVAVFLLGLGIGAFLFRKIREEALLALALVQLFIGLLGMWSYEIILWINKSLMFHIPKLGLWPGSETLAVSIGAFAFLLLPTILMGGTLPLMFESFIPKMEKNTKFIGIIYGMNTFGAFAGAIVPLLVFGTIGLPNSLKLISLFNILISIILSVLILKDYRPATAIPQKVISEEIPSIKQGLFLFIIGFSFMAGFIALALEILFIRFIGIMHGSTSYSFPIIISSFLLSMSIGSIFWSRLRDKMEIRKSKVLPFLLQSSVAVLIPLTLFIFQPVLSSKCSQSFRFIQMFKTVTDLFEKGQFLISIKDIFFFQPSSIDSRLSGHIFFQWNISHTHQKPNGI